MDAAYSVSMVAGQHGIADAGRNTVQPHPAASTGNSKMIAGHRRRISRDRRHFHGRAVSYANVLQVDRPSFHLNPDAQQAGGTIDGKISHRHRAGEDGSRLINRSAIDASD